MARSRSTSVDTARYETRLRTRRVGSRRRSRVERAKELREEVNQHLEILCDALDVCDGDIIRVAAGDHTDDT